VLINASRSGFFNKDFKSMKPAFYQEMTIHPSEDSDMLGEAVAAN
jgi:nitrogen regulatory protein PII-like uncharacterized protein